MSEKKRHSTRALDEARLGHHGPLNGRIDKCTGLTREERDYIMMRLQKLDTARGRKVLKQIGEDFTTDRVNELGGSRKGHLEAAVEKVAKQTGRKRSSIFADMRKSKKRE